MAHQKKGSTVKSFFLQQLLTGLQSWKQLLSALKFWCFWPLTEFCLQEKNFSRISKITLKFIHTHQVSFIFFSLTASFLTINFIFVCAGSLLLRGLLMTVASLVVEHRL